MNSVKKILVISTFYYPIQHIATNRIVAFAKYLKEFGYDVSVLTKGLQNEHKVINGINVYYVNDTYFIKKLDTSKKESKIIHYLKCAWNIAYMNIYSDEDYGWTNNSVKKAYELLKQNHFDYVLSSAPPIGPHIVAYEIKKKYPKIKWIVDMRDALWSPNYPLKIRNSMLRFVENKISECADLLLAVSKPQLQEYKKLTDNKLAYIEIRNGYDFVLKKNNSYNKKEFIIIYTGSFHGNRKPDNFFIALENLYKNNKISNFEVEIIGNNAPINIPNAIAKNINIIDKMPYEKLIDYVNDKASILLMISPSNIEKGCYTGKLFDYIGLCKPILALVPKNDVAAALINKINIGYVAENENITEIENNILKAYFDWKNVREFDPDLNIIKLHHRKEQIRKLVNYLENIK